MTIKKAKVKTAIKKIGAPINGDLGIQVRQKKNHKELTVTLSCVNKMTLRDILGGLEDASNMIFEDAKKTFIANKLQGLDL